MTYLARNTVKYKEKFKAQLITKNSIVSVPDMWVRGQLTCLDARKKSKKKDCKLYVYFYIYNVYCIRRP
jgi:hypothetical protein